MIDAVIRLKLLLTILFVIISFINAFGQNSKEDKYYTSSDRHWLAEIPIWVPGFRGQLAYGEYNLSSSGSDKEKESERLDSDLGIEFYFVGRIAAKYNKLWVQADAFSGKISSAFSYTSLIGNNEKEIVDLTVRGTIPRFIVGYNAWHQTNENHFNLELIPYFGIRYISIYLQSDVFDLTNVIDVNPNWLEPVLGAYIPVEFKRFKGEFQADYGAAKSKNSWVVSNRYRYRISELVDIQLGWNLVRLFHKGTLDGEAFESTIRLFGPTAGIGFRF